MPLQVTNGVGKVGVISTSSTPLLPPDEPTSWPPTNLDSQAQSFITIAGITNVTQKNAINNLVLDLKSSNIWDKMIAVYPMVGGDPETHKWNLKDLRDSDEAFRLSFSGGTTHSSNGVQFNGVNGYADTHIVPSTTMMTSSKHMSFYSRTNSTTTNESVTMGTKTLSSNCYFSIRYQPQNYSISFYGGIDGLFNAVPQTNSIGFYISRRLYQNHNFFKNGFTIRDTFSSTGYTSQVGYSITIGALNDTGTITKFDNKECSFSSIGDGLSDGEIISFNNIVQTFQTTLGR